LRLYDSTSSQALPSCGGKTLVGAGHVTHRKLIAQEGDGKVSNYIFSLPHFILRLRVTVNMKRPKRNQKAKLFSSRPNKEQRSQKPINLPTQFSISMTCRPYLRDYVMHTGNVGKIRKKRAKHEADTSRYYLSHHKSTRRVFHGTNRKQFCL
jgi:hypothetical protein